MHLLIKAIASLMVATPRSTVLGMSRCSVKVCWEGDVVAHLEPGGLVPAAPLSSWPVSSSQEPSSESSYSIPALEKP